MNDLQTFEGLLFALIEYVFVQLKKSKGCQFLFEKIPIS